jgi:hypothetical protein
MWLLKGLIPDHNTIAIFRRGNPKAIKKVFRETVRIAKNFDLIGGKLLAGDSTKMRAQNSKKNNYNKKKIERHLKYIDEKLREYDRQLSQADGDPDEREDVRDKIDRHNKQKKKYQEIQQELDTTGQTQVSTSDPESRHMIVRNNITEVAYNIQSTVDGKHCLAIDYKVTNNNDSKAMGNMLRRTKAILGTNDFTALYDKGYHTGSEFKVAHDLGIDVLGAIPPVAAQAPNPLYNVENFTYNHEEDFYLCPQGNKLTTPGTWHKAKTYRFKRYTTHACIKCPVKHECSKAKYGKGIQRSEYQDHINRNKERIEQNKEYYRKRQAIVEHPYGTIKRQWGFGYILTKKFISRAEADVGLMFIAYNLRRLMTILGKEALRQHLGALLALFFDRIRLIRLQTGRFKLSSHLSIFFGIIPGNLPKPLYI